MKETHCNFRNHVVASVGSLQTQKYGKPTTAIEGFVLNFSGGRQLVGRRRLGRRQRLGRRASKDGGGPAALPSARRDGARPAARLGLVRA